MNEDKPKNQRRKTTPALHVYTAQDRANPNFECTPLYDVEYQTNGTKWSELYPSAVRSLSCRLVRVRCLAPFNFEVLWTYFRKPLSIVFEET